VGEGEEAGEEGGVMTLELNGQGHSLRQTPQTRGSATGRSVQGSRDERKTARQKRTAESHKITT
jgi:hypothetical protein